MTRDVAREAVASAARRLAAEGLLIGTAGNVSVRLQGADAGLIAVTATGVDLAQASAEDVTVVDAYGRVVDGGLAPTSELRLHLDLLARPDVGAVVHTHSPIATALSVVLDELPVLHYQQLALGGALPVVPFAVFGTDEFAASAGAALRDHHAALLANHGTIAVAADLPAAVERAVLLEWLCGLYWRARAVGEPRALTDDQQSAVAAQIASLGYGVPRPADGVPRPGDGTAAPAPRGDR